MNTKHATPNPREDLSEILRFCPTCGVSFTDPDAAYCPLDGGRLVAVPKTSSLVGRRLDGRYQILERIGAGGMGAVYRAIQEPLGREVAIKVLQCDGDERSEMSRRFLHEARVVSRLRHPNTVTLFDYGEADSGELFIAMELLRGRSLDHPAASRDLGLRELVDIARDVCSALHEAHEQGIVHRDLKPGNIFLDQIAGRRVVKVLDFGIAKVAGAQSLLTLAGVVVGTPAYMSPEQTRGHELDRRSDLYSLGVVLYELLCGAPPFQGDHFFTVAMGHLTQPAPCVREHSRYGELPDALVALVEALLEKDPVDRPASAEVVERALDAIARELASTRPGDDQRPRCNDDRVIETAELPPLAALPQALEPPLALELPEALEVARRPAPGRRPLASRLTSWAWVCAWLALAV
jgi:serine/threonine protein kinase